jgi:hypothetical protein
MPSGRPGVQLWRKSSHSSSQANCVEVAFPATTVAVRDSKDPGAGPVLISARSWRYLLGALVRGNPC